MRAQPDLADASHEIGTTESAGRGSGTTASDATGDETDAQTDPVDLDTDTVHHLLQNERRRNVLRFLRDTDGPVQMRDIAEQVAAWEYDTTVRQLMSDQRQRVYIGLYQSHLPKFDNAGVIDYNQNRGIVEKRPAAEELMPYLDDPAEEDGDDNDSGSAAGGDVDAAGGDVDAAGGDVDAADGDVDAAGGDVDAAGGDVDAAGGDVDAADGDVENDGSARDAGSDDGAHETAAETPPWERYQLAATAAGALALASAGFGVPFGGPSAFLVAALVLTVFGGLTVANVVTSRDS
jgi:hypothetical protein